jgi:hypothetical protein
MLPVAALPRGIVNPAMAGLIPNPTRGSAFAMEARGLAFARLCNHLKPHGVQMQRRVRRKSLYLGVSSDMSHAPEQVRQSIVHLPR